ncbi:putative allergen Ole e 1 [Helianthus annuus]|nr:putative allergen Ole e 1 [Helianthus annuus]
MAKSGLILALCVLLPALISASRPMSRPYVLQGRVYCDTCRAGFETSATTYIPDESGGVQRLEWNARTGHKNFCTPLTDSRFANAMGFMKDEVMSGCTMLLQSLMEEED